MNKASLNRSVSFGSAGSGGGDTASAQGSESGERLPDQEDGDASAEVLKQRGGVQEAVFGVMHNLSKKRLVEGWRFALSVMVIDYLQLAVFFIGYNFPWRLDFEGWYWKWLSWFSFTNLLPPGIGLINGNHDLYMAILFTMAAILLLSAAGCVFIAIKHKSSQSHYLWLTKVLKIVVTFFFEIFYISTLGIFVVALDCTYSRSPIVNEKFRSVVCFASTNLATIGVSIAAALLSIVMAFFFAVANTELNPTSTELNSQAHSRSAFWRYALISLITLINQIFPSYTKIQAIACIIITTYLCYMYVRYIPFRTAWINGMQASFFGALSWASFLIVLMAFFYQSSDKLAFTVLLWAGLLVVVPMVWVALYIRVRHAHKIALKYRLGLKAIDTPVIHKFIDELEVEIVARCGRIRDQWGDLIPAWVDTADLVYKAGLAQFPESAYLHIAYSSFLIDQRRAPQAGSGLLEVARKLETSMGERFMIFVRDREQKQRSGNSGGSSTDLLSYVEFQNSFKAVLDMHRQALKANRSFWRLLVRKDVAFGDLTGAFAAMEAAEKRADSTFVMVLERYPNSPKLLQAYALYLESVKSNPSRASRYRAEASILEKDGGKTSRAAALTDGVKGSDESALAEDKAVGAMVDDSNDAVIVINSGGTLQFVNKKALELFGYKQGELEGQNVKVLMPPPYSSQHNQYIQRYKKTGKGVRMGKPAIPTVALDAQGFSFTVNLAIKQLQRGDSKSFMGVFKPIHEDMRVATIWVNGGGNILGIDRGFHDVCGYSLADVRGEVVASLGLDAGMEQHFKQISELLRNWQYNAAELETSKHTFEVSLKHKYGAAVPVSGSASFAGTESVRLIVLKFELDERVEKLGVVSVSPAGQVVYANAALETMLGYEPGFLVGKKKLIKDILKPPYAQMHLRWMQQVAQNSDISTMAPTSCRTGRTVLLLGRNNKQVAVHMRVVEAQVGKVACLTATATEVEVPEADSWGGGDVKDVWNNSKRMLLLVHADGRVLAVKADPATALQGFGQDVTQLCGHSIFEVIEDFTKPAGLQRDRPSGPQLLSRLAQETSRIQAAGGAASFRVGVVPSAAANKQLKQRSRGVTAGHVGSIPCRMVVLPVADSELDVQELVDEGAVKEEDVADGGQVHVVKLWQDDMLEAVLEIDSHLKIKAADVDGTYLFGSRGLKGHFITRFIHHSAELTGSAMRVEDFLAVKRTMLKHSGEQAVGEKLEVEALHADGSRMLVHLQGADKYGDGSRWVLRVTVHPAQPTAWARPNLVEALSHCGAAVTASPQSSRSSTPVQENYQIAAVTTRAAAAQSADGRSEHSMDDATSNNDGVSVCESDAADRRGSYSDYKRAKRFRKLNKMLSSPKAQMTMRTLKRASAVMVLLLLGIHALFFGLTIQGVNGYQTFFQKVVDAGQTCSSTSKLLTVLNILIACTDANNVNSLRYTNPALASYYVSYYRQWMLDKADSLDMAVGDVMFGSTPGKLEMPPTEEQRVLFLNDRTGIVVKQVSPSRQYNSSLWDLSQRFTTASRMVDATAQTTARSTLVNYTDSLFMSQNKDALANGLLQNLNFQKEVAKLKLKDQTKELVIFMVSEAGGLIPLCCLCLYVLLTLVQRARLKLFNVFLAVPRPVVMQLATKEVQVSLDDEEEGEDDDGDAWMRQQQKEQADAGSGGKGVGFSLTSSKRKLRSNGLAIYIMMVPFMLWCVVVCIIYAVSIVRLQTSSSSVANLVGSQMLHYYCSVAFTQSVKIAWAASATARATNQALLGSTTSNIVKYTNGLLYGSASLGLDGAVHQGNKHEQLWFGEGCLQWNVSKCLAHNDPLYQATNNGLNQLVNIYILNLHELAMLPTANSGFNTSQFNFIWRVAREGTPLEDGIRTNTADFVSDGQGRMALILIVQIIAMVLGVVQVMYFHFRMLAPFLRHSKRESRRVAELLSQLPQEMNVEGLVLACTNQQEEEEEDSRHPNAAKAPGGPLGRLFGNCWGRGKSRVSPAPHKAKASEANKGLSIVVSQNTSKDKEAESPAVGAHDVSTKLKNYKETLHKHHSEGESEGEDPTLWDSHRTPRKITFAFPTS